MEITQQLTQLAQLANIEAKMKVCRQKLKDLPAVARAAKEEAAAEVKALDALEAAHFDLERNRRSLDVDTKAERDKLRKWQNRADMIRGDREHAALQSEIGSQKRSIRILEEKSLEIMQELEDLEKKIEPAQDRTENKKIFADQEWKKVEDDVASIEEELAGYERGRDKLLENLPPLLVKRYHRIAERKGGGVAVVFGETCNSCNRKVRPQLVLQLHKGEILETCEGCQRILVHESMTRAPEDGDGATAAT